MKNLKCFICGSTSKQIEYVKEHPWFPGVKYALKHSVCQNKKCGESVIQGKDLGEMEKLIALSYIKQTSKMPDDKFDLIRRIFGISLKSWQKHQKIQKRKLKNT